MNKVFEKIKKFNKVTIEDVYEPYLMQKGFIARTPRGRIPLEPAYKHFGYKVEDILKA